jgi:outer membrane receptor protein involved in Fe transport
MKGLALDRITYSAALFLVDWKKIQIQIPSPVNGIPSIVNGGDAQSKGVELEAHTNLTENLDLTVGYTYTHAELTEDTQIRSGFNGLKGDSLPGVPKHTAMVAMNYTQPLAAGASQILYHLDGSYRSSANTALNETARNFYKLPGFETWNASVTWSNDTYKLGLFVNNITDELGATAVDIANDTTPSSRPGSLLFTQTPRTIGLNAGVKF